MTKRKSANEINSEDRTTSSDFTVEDLDFNERTSTVGNEQTHFRGKKFKNSLDSDEEDDEIEATKYNMLDPEDLEGEEENTIDQDGEIKITPFNMKEELEEGHFDKDGTFIFHKDSDQIKDSWLDNIDWIKLKDQKTKAAVKEDSDSEEEEVNTIEIYKAMLEIMKPKETVQKTLQRLGGKNASASSRWKNKTQRELTEDEVKNKEKLIQLTSLADKLVSSGNMEIYQQTFERLSFLVTAQLNPPPKFESTSEAADMFGDDFDADKVASGDAQRAAQSSSTSTDESNSSSEVKWEFKWENCDQAEVYGPHPTSEIMRWIEEGYFQDGVWIRKVGEANAPFYSSNRVDFELYT